MALTRTVHGNGQIPVICQFCENERKITNKCLDCNLLMCENCSVKLHPKVKGASDHTVVNIGILGPQHSQKFKDFSSIKCKEHPSQTACLFCNTCDQALCPGCVSSVHQKHNIGEFQNMYQLKVERLHCGQVKLERDYKEIERRSNNLGFIKTAENIRRSNTRQNIRDRVTLVKSKIDEHANELITEIDDENAKFDIIIRIEQSKINDISEKLNANKQKLQDMTDTSDMVDFFAKIADVNKSIEECLPNPSSITTRKLEFLPGSVYQPNYVGKLQQEKIKREIDIKMEITKKYNSEEDVVQFLTSGPDNSLWYSNNVVQKVLKRVKPGEKILEIVSKENLTVYGLAFIPSYGLLFSTDVSTLKFIPENSNEICDSRFSVGPLEPKCIHFTKDNKLAVGAKSKGPLYQSFGRRVVILMDIEGNKLSTFESKKKKKRLFTHTWGIASTTNGHIFILDRINSSCEGRLVVMKEDDGSVVDIYNGREGYWFVPRGIVATEADNIIISDCGDPEVSFHILNNYGKLISYYNTRDIGIELPFSMTFHANGHFYIGGTTIKFSGNKAELFELDFSEI